jgi:uncharacterized cupredoxin-like copper-binding protein
MAGGVVEGAGSTPGSRPVLGGGADDAAVEPTGSATRVAVALTDALRIEPDAMAVPRGVPVTFVITNTGKVLHEFTLGDAAEQDAHDAEMRADGGMGMPSDEPNAVSVEPGQTKELTHTFKAAGRTLAGCHVVGHYGAGMKAEVVVS